MWWRLSLVALLVVVGCRPSPPAPNASELVDRAAVRTAALQSAHFRLDVSNGAMLIGPSLQVTQAEGDVGRPDLLSMRATVRLGGIIVETEFRQVDGVGYVLSPFSRKWEPLDGPLTPVPLLDSTAGVSQLVRAVVAPSVSANNAGGWSVTGRVAASAVTALVGGTPASSDLDVTAQVTDDGLVQELVLHGTVVEGESKDLTRTFEFSNFDAPVTIEAPPV